MKQIDAYIASLSLPDRAKAYRVGGSVRDEILGRKPKDGDYVVQHVTLDELGSAIALSGAQPTRMQTRDGVHIGWRANKRGLGLVEIALPRTEVSTGPGHRDFEIIIDPELSLAEDAERRDFTMNALYRDVQLGDILDPLGTGWDAVRERILYTTHPDSFRDDPLRILRAARFVARGFSVSSETHAQMIEHADAVDGLTDKGVSGTALDELSKILMGRKNGNGLRLLRDTGSLVVLLPELAAMIGFQQDSRYHDLTTDEHTFVALEAAAGMHVDLRVRMALLFHDSGKPASAWIGEDGRKHYYAAEDGLGLDHESVGAALAATALKRLNAPKQLRRDVDVLIERHMVSLSGKTRPAKVRRWRVELGDELLADLLKHRLCDCMGKGSIDNSQLMALARLEQIREEAQRKHVPTSAKELAVGGQDAMDLGLSGPKVGKALAQILHEAVSQPDERHLSREWQLTRLERLA